MKLKTAFIGGGNMGVALIRGLIAHGLDAASIHVGEAVQARRVALADELGVFVSADNREVVADVDVVVLAVKPQDMAATTRALAPALARRKPLVLTVAAGIRSADVAGWCGPGTSVLRAVPNRPALNGAGATALFAPASLSSTHRELAEKIFGAVGTTVWVPDEDLLDVATALSGSGLAYFFLLTELITEAAIARGLEAETARELAIQTLFGAGRMARDSDGDLARLRAEVTSKGGTTAAAIRSFDAANLRGIVAAALGAATDRGREMAKEFGKPATT